MKKDRDIVIIGAARTPIGRFGGALSSLRAYQLANVAMEQAMKKAGIEGEQLSDIIFGDCVQGADEANTARTAALAIGIPVEVPAVTIQRQCSSGMQAVIFGTQQILCGDSEIVLAGGVESMSSAPYLLPAARWGQRLQHGQMIDAVWEILYSGSNLLENGRGYIMGATAESHACLLGRAVALPLVTRVAGRGDVLPDGDNGLGDALPVLLPETLDGPQHRLEQRLGFGEDAAHVLPDRGEGFLEGTRPL